MARKKKIIEMEIQDTVFPNKSIGQYEGNTIICKGGIKGQKVRVLLNRKRQDYIEGRILELIEDSPLETEIGCPHQGECGGCVYQKLSYETELKYKETQVLNLFREAEIVDFNYLGIGGSPSIIGYRNKMEYTFGDLMKEGPLSLGLNKKGRYYEVVEIPNCSIADRDFTIIWQEVLRYFRGLGIPKYNKRTHEGVLRHLVIRKALSTGEILVNLVTSSQEEINIEEFKNLLIQCNEIEGNIVGIFHTINDSLSDAVIPEDLRLIYGRNYIIEEILGLKFKVSPFSFFQTNTFGAERLYSIVREFVGDEKNNIVFDLYSGTGTIAQILSPICQKVIGIEIVEEAVEKACENAKLNKLDNVEFIAGDVLKVVDTIEEKPNLIIIDPPREGIHPKAINKIIDFNPDRFVYVSCNPVTLVRDLKVFEGRGYKLDKMRLMDQFPRTPHVEAVVKIEKS